MTKKKTSVTLPEDLHRRLKSACTDRSLTMYQAHIEALTSWIEGTTYVPPPQSPYKPSELKRIKGLIRIMRSGDTELSDAITDAIAEIERRVKQPQTT